MGVVNLRRYDYQGCTHIDAGDIKQDTCGFVSFRVTNHALNSVGYCVDVADVFRNVYASTVDAIARTIRLNNACYFRKLK